MKLTVNNQAQVIDEGATVADLVDLLALQGKRIAMEINGEIIPRSQYAATPLSESDDVEVVHAVGGG